MGYTKPCSYPLTFTLIYSHPLLLILNPLPLTFDSFSSTPTHLQLPSTHFKPIPDHVQTLSLISSPYPNTYTQSSQSPTIPTHIQSLYFRCLGALHTCVLMCLCVLRAHVAMQSIPMDFTAYVFILSISLCVKYVKTIYLYCSFLKHAYITVLFLVTIFLPWFLCPCFSVLSSL